MKWLGLCGKAGSGKDWVCSRLAEHVEVNRVCISENIKSMLLALDPKIEGRRRLQDITREEGGIENAKWIYPEIRRLLQRMGTQAGRATLGENVWIDAALRTGKEGALNVVTDVRFPNEAEAIRSAGGVLVRVVRPFSLVRLDGPEASHASEVLVDTLRVDHVFLNEPKRAKEQMKELLELVLRTAAK